MLRRRGDYHGMEATVAYARLAPGSSGSDEVKLKQVYLTAAEPEKLSRFYEALGMSIRFVDPGKWVQFESEKTAFCVAGPSESVSDPGRNAVVVFEVENLEAAVACARDNGAKICGDVRDMGGHGRTAQFKDPEENLVQLFQSAGK
jgi:predicted enzyme related to lactoylglutathione lyase